MNQGVLIVYGSSKGRTGRIADVIAKVLSEFGCVPVLKNVFEVRPLLLTQYAYVVLGCSTYGQGDLQQDFWEFERSMDELDLTGIKVAVFGSGNSRYAYFAEAVDILEAKVKILNARLLLPSRRQDMMAGSPEDEKVRSWARDLAEAIVEDSEDSPR